MTKHHGRFDKGTGGGHIISVMPRQERSTYPLDQKTTISHRSISDAYMGTLSRIQLHGVIMHMGKGKKLERMMDKDDARKLLVAAWRANERKELSPREWDTLLRVIGKRGWMAKYKPPGTLHIHWSQAHTLRQILRREKDKAKHETETEPTEPN